VGKKFQADPAVAQANLQTALANLKDGVAQTATPAGLLAHLTFATRGNLHKYSFRNQILIGMQCPAAHHVGGYHYWIKQGRRPLAGRGCRILAPSLYTKKVETRDAEGVVTEEERTMRGFRTVVVWDISATTDAQGHPYTGPVAAPPVLGGRPVAAFTGPADFATDDTQDELAAEIDETLRDWALREGVRVISALLDPGHYGSYREAGQVLTCSTRYGPLTTCSSTVHELAHWQEYLLGVRESYNAGELLAEGVAYVVLHRYGLDTSRFSFAYVRSYGADLKMYGRMLAAIQQVAAVIIAALERADDDETAGEPAEEAA
jgi:hypothetical protein